MIFFKQALLFKNGKNYSPPLSVVQQLVSEPAQEIGDKLISSYEGNEKVKDAKVQTYRV
jgi:hypothetical protein